MSHNGNHLYSFGDFSFDTDERVLLRNEKPVPLTPKTFDLLQVLVENHGRIVEKEKLMSEVWADSFVEDSNLTFTVRQLRKTLADDAHQPTYIETVPRRGCRFIAEVREFRNNALPAAQIENSEFIPPQPQPKPYFLIVTGIILLVGIFGASFVWFRGDNKPLAPKQSKLVRLTNNGKVTNMTISPDGKYLVFAQQEGVGESLWLRQVTTGSQMQILPAQAVNYVGLTVSPDNDYIYYSVFSKNSVASPSGDQATGFAW